MKNTILVSGTLLAAFTSLMLMSNNTGVATNQSKDRTGSPVGETQQCNACHSGGNFGVTIDTRLLDAGGNPVTEYVPFAQYTYEVELTGAGAQFGFQTVSLINSSNANAGNFTALTSNAKVVTLNGRKYGEQVSRSTSGLFQFQWNAPASGSGDVKFYAAGIACNANGTTSGDQAITSPSLTISEVTTGIVESSEEIISVYPNPAVDLVTINIPGKIFHVSAFDAGGKEVFSSGNINSQTVIPVSGWPDGFYLIRFSGEVNDARIFLKK